MSTEMVQVSLVPMPYLCLYCTRNILVPIPGVVLIPIQVKIQYLYPLCTGGSTHTGACTILGSILVPVPYQFPHQGLYYLSGTIPIPVTVLVLYIGLQSQHPYLIPNWHMYHTGGMYSTGTINVSEKRMVPLPLQSLYRYPQYQYPFRTGDGTNTRASTIPVI